MRFAAKFFYRNCDPLARHDWLAGDALLLSLSVSGGSPGGNKMNNQIIDVVRKKQIVVAFIVAGAIVIAIPIFIFGLTRFVYVLGIKETLAPSALKKLDAWRKGEAELKSRLVAPTSPDAGRKNRWLLAPLRQITTILDGINRGKGS